MTRLNYFNVILAVILSNLSSTTALKYSLYQTTPHTVEQVDYLMGLWKHNYKYNLDFWQAPTSLNHSVHFMAPAHDGSLKTETIMDLLSSKQFEVTVLLDDVESKIVQRQHEHEAKARRRSKRQVPGSAYIDVTQYHTYARIMIYMHELARTHPNMVKIITIGYSHESRPINVIKIGTNTGRSKPAMWLDGGIHAREWVAPATAVWIVNKLVTGYNVDPQIRRLVDELDWYIVPVLNVDGYEYSHTSSAPEVRLWRKNRSPEVCISGGSGFQLSPFGRQEQCCRGVDLNRNYDFYWGGEGSSSDPCSEIYQGTSAFSEPETRATRDFLLANRNQIKSLITMHSYSQIWMYPYGHRRGSYPPDVEDLKRVAFEASNALTNVYGTKYTVGTGADTLYPASGGADDWAKTGAGIKYSFLIELRPTDNVWDGFLLDENQIEQTGIETFEGIKSVANNVIKEFGQPQHVSASRPAPVIASQITAPVQTQCRDGSPYCSFWATHGACTSWPLTKQQCPKSCGVCTTAVRRAPVNKTVCFDMYNECSTWARQNLCDGQNSLAVRQQCQKSCGQC